MFRPGQASRRQTSFTFFPLHLAAAILGLRTMSHLLLNFRHVPCNPLILCIACSLPGNRRARSVIVAHSSSISGGLNILFPSGLFYCRCVPATCLVPSGRSYITSHFPTLPGSAPCRSPENRHYVITLLSL